ncbi:ATP-binding cassette domain-containing protein [Isoptericola sp. F-RaC21]|uniref:ATP-binding cassette domain-containing protein n=1 Tax=Isoptericola sp. F-RaC21 TaxID=3141452 RepID=UPI00315BB7FA
MAAGLTRPTRGTVRIGGDAVFTSDTTVAQATRVRLERIGMVLQSPQLFGSLIAMEQLELHAHERGRQPSSVRGRAMHLRDPVGMANHAHKRPAQLSGGQRQPWQSHRHWSVGPRCCWSTSPRPLWITSAARRWWN